MDLKEAINKKTEAISKEIIAWRQHIHQHPELELKCYKTAEFVSQVLGKYGLEVITGIAQTGIKGILQGSKSGPTIALRVDMDALPIHEQTSLPYASQNQGVMHACGHDGHIAIGLGVAAVLSHFRDDLKGTLIFIFQPGEESPGGAKLMIDEGVLQNPKVEAIFGFHIFPDIPAKTVGIRYGTMCARNEELDIVITGKGGHGAKPEQCIDPIVAAAYFITSIQSIVSRSSDPNEPVVISICQIAGGSSCNVIPEKILLKGTIRTLHSDTGKVVKRKLSELLNGLEIGFGVKGDMRIIPDCPALLNDFLLTKYTEDRCIELLGNDAVLKLEIPSMGADDFAFFTNEIPATYLRLGCYDENKGFVHKLHTPYFDFDETVLIDGTKIFSWLLASFEMEK